MKMDQKKLKQLVARRHPEYSELLPHWEFMKNCYEGGRSWFAKNIFRYIKEGDKEFQDRLERAYRFNHTREVVDLVGKYIFKQEVARNKDDAPESVKKFWDGATLNKLSIKDFMKQIEKNCSIYGRVWVVVDNNNTGGVMTKAEEAAAGVRTYAYIVTPENACDMSFDENGELNWILIHEQERDDADPTNSTGEMTDRFRLWERHQWTLFKAVRKGKGAGSMSAFDYANHVVSIANRNATTLAEKDRGGRTGSSDASREGQIASKLGMGSTTPDASKGYEIVIDGPYPHSFGAVPVFPADNIIGHELYRAPALIDDVAYLDRAVANYLSNLDAIIQDQTFSQLVMPAQGIMPGEDGYDKLVEMGTKRVFTYNSDGGGAPAYISPDVKQADLVLRVINKIINEIYHSVGLAGERTKEDNALGIDNSSGVAKAYDFERVNSLLAAKADSLELVENRMVEFVARWNGDTIKEGQKLVSYPDNFDVRGLYDEFEIAARLSLVEAPDGVRRKQMEAMIDKLFPQLASDLKKQMLDELKDWPPQMPDPLEMAAQGMGSKKMMGSTGKQDVGGANDKRVDDSQKGNRKDSVDKTK